ncbi:MAG: HDOD domain-containing protein [Bacteroidales bacterium]|nr:HDOD domain-containing protein [Candidatus Latescibacterota bacterium]
MTVIDLSRVIGSINQIPPLPAAATRLISTVSNPDHALGDVIRIVENDSTITAYVLKVANSAFSAQREYVSSVKDAILLLGENMVISAALRVCASGLFGKSLDGYEADSWSMWKHSMGTAVAAKYINAFIKDGDYSDVVYTAGIMHDIGKVVISDFLSGKPGEIKLILEESGQKDFLYGEREVLGTDHCEVGGLLGEKWNFPESIISVLRYHHHPAESPEQWKPLVHIVQLADAVAMMCGASTGNDCLQYEIDKGHMNYLDISEQDMEKIMRTTETEVETLMGLMSDDTEYKQDQKDDPS